MPNVENDFDREKHVFHSPKYRSVVQEALTFFVNTPVHSLPPPERFIGAGVYALYYMGDSPSYLQIAEQNRKTRVLPRYVGKAVPPGWRTARTHGSESADLRGRLAEHSRSIQDVKGLNISDFKCRFVILEKTEGDLVVPVEAELIRKYQPVWNTVVDGFGNHDPGSGRYNQAPSEWDVLHPGRSWAERLTGKPPVLQDIHAKLKSYYSHERLS
jgi:hypothetical protein